MSRLATTVVVAARQTQASVALSILLLVAFVAVAVAGPASDTKVEASKAFDIDPAGGGDAEVGCPSGRRVVGGGTVQSGGATNLALHSSGPLDQTGRPAELKDGDRATRWSGRVEAQGLPLDRTAKVFALCSKSSDAIVETTKVNVDAAQMMEVFRSCPNGRALGGGVTVYGSAKDVYLWASGPLDDTGVWANTGDGDKAKQWYAVIENASAHRKAVKVTVLCSADSNATIEASFGSATSAADGVEAYAECPSGSRVTGGGMVQLGDPHLLLGASGPLDSTGIPSETRDGDVARMWYVALRNQSAVQTSFKAFAICEPS